VNVRISLKLRIQHPYHRLAANPFLGVATGHVVPSPPDPGNPYPPLQSDRQGEVGVGVASLRSSRYLLLPSDTTRPILCPVRANNWTDLNDLPQKRLKFVQHNAEIEAIEGGRVDRPLEPYHKNGQSDGLRPNKLFTVILCYKGCGNVMIRLYSAPRPWTTRTRSFVAFTSHFIAPEPHIMLSRHSVSSLKSFGIISCMSMLPVFTPPVSFELIHFSYFRRKLTTP